MPSTWLRWGVDADGDGVADPWNATDAIYAAARYLAAAGGADRHRARRLRVQPRRLVRPRGARSRPGLRPGRDHADGRPAATAGKARRSAPGDRPRQRAAPGRAGRREQQLRKVSQGCTPSGRGRHCSRIVWLRSGAPFSTTSASMRPARPPMPRASSLEQAQSALATATQSVQAPSFAQGVGTLMGAASFHDNYVFPVGGGPQLVSVAHTHHDYPAADIAAPAGSPVYAISNAVVLNAWHSADPRCGIGMTIRTAGRSGLDVLPPRLPGSRRHGRRLAGGRGSDRSRRLDRPCDRAASPSPASARRPSYPQNQAWFQSFAGTAFRWQDALTPLELPDATPPSARVFSVVALNSRDAADRFHSWWGLSSSRFLPIRGTWLCG